LLAKARKHRTLPLAGQGGVPVRGAGGPTAGQRWTGQRRVCYNRFQLSILGYAMLFNRLQEQFFTACQQWTAGNRHRWFHEYLPRKLRETRANNQDIAFAILWTSVVRERLSANRSLWEAYVARSLNGETSAAAPIPLEELDKVIDGLRILVDQQGLPQPNAPPYTWQAALTAAAAAGARRTNGAATGGRLSLSSPRPSGR
jgi:hypothetical protein